MKEEELRELLQRRVPQVADALMDLAALTIRIYISTTDETRIPIGGSKLGGGYVLPLGVLCLLHRRDNMSCHAATGGHMISTTS